MPEIKVQLRLSSCFQIFLSLEARVFKNQFQHFEAVCCHPFVDITSPETFKNLTPNSNKYPLSVNSRNRYRFGISFGTVNCFPPIMSLEIAKC